MGRVLKRMVDECVIWDSVTYVSVLGLCAQIRDLQLGLQIHAQLLKTGLVFDVFVGSTLIDTYEARTLQSLIVFDVRHSSVSVFDTNTTPVLRSIF